MILEYFVIKTLNSVLIVPRPNVSGLLHFRPT